MFGLSGTGKTTLSADPKRSLIGDDEHCWSDDGVFNIEGGCYAKAIYLSRESEPEIFQALRFGAVLENVVYDNPHHHVDFDDTSITQNTRGAYPIEFVTNARIPCVAGHPTDVIFLTCDAFGVLPPVSRLTPEQAMYHFINGYTAKVAGTEVGVKEPQVTFSPCFGGPFLVWHPQKYADLLADRIRTHNANVWLVNTGWSGGPYGVGSRMKLSFTRAIIDAIHAGQLADAPTIIDPIFGLHVVTSCPNVPDEILNPRQTWSDPTAYDATAKNSQNCSPKTTLSSKLGCHYRIIRRMSLRVRDSNRTAFNAKTREEFPTTSSTKNCSASKPHCGTTLRVVNRDAERRATILQKNIAFGDNDVARRCRK